MYSRVVFYRLKDNWREYIFHDADGMIGFIGWEKDFRKAMKKK